MIDNIWIKYFPSYYQSPDYFTDFLDYFTRHLYNILSIMSNNIIYEYFYYVNFQLRNINIFLHLIQKKIKLNLINTKKIQLLFISYISEFLKYYLKSFSGHLHLNQSIKRKRANHLSISTPKWRKRKRRIVKTVI